MRGYLDTEALQLCKIGNDGFDAMDRGNRLISD